MKKKPANLLNAFEAKAQIQTTVKKELTANQKQIQMQISELRMEGATDVKRTIEVQKKLQYLQDKEFIDSKKEFMHTRN